MKCAEGGAFSGNRVEPGTPGGTVFVVVSGGVVVVSVTVGCGVVVVGTWLPQATSAATTIN